MTKDFDIEIETGLKHDIREFERKLAKATKKTYVVVPNESGEKRYQELNNVITSNTIVLNIAAFLLFCESKTI